MQVRGWGGLETVLAPGVFGCVVDVRCWLLICYVCLVGFYNDFYGLCLSHVFMRLLRDLPAVCKVEGCLFVVFYTEFEGLCLSQCL